MEQILPIGPFVYTLHLIFHDATNKATTLTQIIFEISMWNAFKVAPHPLYFQPTINMTLAMVAPADTFPAIKFLVFQFNHLKAIGLPPIAY